MTDEGYVKFQADWQPGPLLPSEALEELTYWRQRLYALGLIGTYDNGTGYGNISRRDGKGEQFIISGSATGNFPELTAAHYALVTEVKVEANTLICQGPVIASSESMSHAMVYRELPWVGGVIHVHHLGLWEALLHRAPTTDASATYGSPEMARSIVHLIRTTDLAERRIFVMEGHREGVFSFGATLAEAFEVLMQDFRALK